MPQKRIERKALIVGIVVNVLQVAAGLAVFFMTGLKAMFLDAAFTAISVLSGFVAAYLSSRTVRTTDRFPNGMFALEPIYAICKAMLTLSLLLFSLIDVTQVAYNYFALGIGSRIETGPVVIYEILTVIVCFALYMYYRSENHKIRNSSTMLTAEQKSTLVDGSMSFGIGVVAVFLLLLPTGTPLDFLHYTGDFFITTLLVAVSAKEPIGVLRDSFVELVGGAVTDGPTTAHAADLAAAHLPNGTALDAVQVYKTGMSYNVEVYLACRDEFISAAELVGRKRSLERALAERFHIVDVDFVFD